jgi:hypothetical protein
MVEEEVYKAGISVMASRISNPLRKGLLLRTCSILGCLRFLPLTSRFEIRERICFRLCWVARMASNSANERSVEC